MADESDFVTQLVKQLRASKALVAALGEDASAPRTTKVHGEQAQGSPDLPYLVLTEDEESSAYAGTDGQGVLWRHDRGTITATITAAGKAQARRIGELVTKQLDVHPPPITPADGDLLELSRKGASFKPTADQGPGTPSEAVRVVTFLYVIQRPST